MKEVLIAASPRQALGKGSARKIRATGQIPGVMYGPEIEPMPILVPEAEFRKAYRASAGTSTIFTLNVNGKPNKVIIREMQRDPITSRITHLDFHAISMNRPIHIQVPVHLVGTPIGVKAEGGIMQTLLREIEISCLPTNIPEHVEVDVTNLGIGDSIHVRDVTIPNVDVLTESSSTIVVISAPTIIKVETPAVEAVQVEGAEGAAPAEGAEGAPAAAAAAPGEAKKEEKKDEKEKKGKEKG
ncbi:MAG: 50S ribosomal protein L25/general stress protein Ctc [Candidatus Zixiibacteriota bacterium]